jgi:hypothetical protein
LQAKAGVEVVPVRWLVESVEQQAHLPQAEYRYKLLQIAFDYHPMVSSTHTWLLMFFMSTASYH